MKRQAHIIYSGMVQGVGFRYTVNQFASQLDVKGWVKNLPDGTVEIRVEGTKKDIDLLCQQVEDHFNGYIRDKKIDFQDPQESFESFNIVF